MPKDVEQEYRTAKQDWLVARENLTRTLNNLARQQASQKGSLSESGRGLDWYLNWAFRTYEPVATRYMKALHAYAKAHPESIGDAMDEHLGEAAAAQEFGASSVAEKHLATVGDLGIEAVRQAHQIWVRTGNKKTFSALVATLADAQVLGVQEDSAVSGVSDEVFSLLEQGKVRRETPKKAKPKSKRKRRWGKIPSVYIKE